MPPTTSRSACPETNLILVMLFAGLMAMLVGVLFGIPSLRIKGFYLAVATLASQFFLEWVFARVKWFTNYSPSGSVAVGKLELFGMPIQTPMEKYLFVLAIVVVMTLAAKNLIRGRLGRMWMATRDMDIAAEIIGIRPLHAKLSAFAVSRSTSASPARCGRSCGSARGSRWPSTSTARSRSCS
jgi:branched-chain amino acid transport system permease protein